MGYQSDLAKNKSLQNDVNRHNDNYSSLDLKQDLVLVTALISHFLKNIDFSDLEMFSINRKELCELIDLKRRLFETNIKLEDLAFKQGILVRKLSNYKKSDFATATGEFISVIQDLVPPENMEEMMGRLKEIVKSLPSYD